MVRKKRKSRVRFARVPAGGETCPFCLMLASRGAVYYSEETAGANSHYHAHCRCQIVPSWDDAAIEGYDPDLYYDMWKHPEKYANGGQSSVEEWLSEVTRSVGAAFNEEYSKGYEQWIQRVLDVEHNGIHRQQQEVHIEGTQAYKNTLKQRKQPQSAFYGDLEQVDELIARYIGNGTPDIDDLGQWEGTEVCVADRVVGFVYGRKGQRLDTRCFKIHYANDGIHAVPRYDEGYDPDEIRRHLGRPRRSRSTPPGRRAGV